MGATRSKIGAGAIFAVLTAGVLAARADGGDKGLVVHEWGTFSCFSGSDGVLLEFHPANTDLPRFVHRGLSDQKSGYAGTVSLETPVLYLYSDSPLTAAVKAEFPTGVFTEWYPWAEQSRSKNTLNWTGIRVRPNGPGDLPVATPIRDPASADENHYYAARATDAAPVEIAYEKKGVTHREREGFLFYRGVGDLKTPMAVTALPGGSFTLRAADKEAIGSSWLIEVGKGRVRFQEIGSLAPGVATRARLPETWSSPETLRVALAANFVKAGLFEKEAQAMLKTWEGAWLGEEGTRVLYVLPNRWTGRALPLQVAPKPAALVRVLVGRHDILTPERERAIDQLVQKLQEARSAEQTAAKALEKLGRFAWPAQQRSAERLAKPH